jgi:hypothetical protein
VGRASARTLGSASRCHRERRGFVRTSFSRFTGTGILTSQLSFWLDPCLNCDPLVMPNSTAQRVESDCHGLVGELAKTVQGLRWVSDTQKRLWREDIDRRVHLRTWPESVDGSFVVEQSAGMASARDEDWILRRCACSNCCDLSSELIISASGAGKSSLINSLIGGELLLNIPSRGSYLAMSTVQLLPKGLNQGLHLLLYML